MKQKIKLSETQLRNIIKKCINEALNNVTNKDAYSFINEYAGNNQTVINNYIRFIEKSIQGNNELDDFDVDDLQYYINNGWFDFEDSIQNDSDYAIYYKMKDLVCGNQPFCGANDYNNFIKVTIACIAIIKGWDWNGIEPALTY